MPPMPRDIRRGDPVTAQWLNKVKNTAITDIRVGPGLSMHHSGPHVTIGLTQRQIIPTRDRPILAKITELNNDYVSVKRVGASGNVVGDEFRVAKPFKLRHSASYYPGISTITTVDTNSVTANDGSEDESWVIPDELVYGVNDYIMAARTTYSGVTVDSDDLKWIDLNVDGRAWAKESS